MLRVLDEVVSNTEAAGPASPDMTFPPTSLIAALERRGGTVHVVSTPRGHVLDVEGLPALGTDALRALSRETGVELAPSTITGARQRLRVRRPGSEHRDHRPAGVALGLFARTGDGLRWTSAGLETLARLQAMLAAEAAAAGASLALAPLQELSAAWLLDELPGAHDAFVVHGDCARERAQLLALRAAAALGLEPDVVTPAEVRACDRLGRSWCVATLAISPRETRGALLGGAPRALAIALEHLHGALPTWLAPEQVRLLPIGAVDASAVVRELGALRVRVDGDGPLASRVGAATAARVPYLAFVGHDELEHGVVRVRVRGSRAQSVLSWAAFADHVTAEARSRRPGPLSPEASPNVGAPTPLHHV